MLFALVVGGLAAAIAAPVFLSSGDEEDPIIDDIHEDTTEATSVLDHALQETGGDEESDDNAPDDDVHVLDGFEPGRDAFNVELDDPDAVIEAGWDEEGVPFFTADTGDGVLSASFPGLTEVPVDDIYFTVAASEGDEPVTLTLSEVLERGTTDEMPPERIVLDGGDVHGENVFDMPLDDLGSLSPIEPTLPDVRDAADAGSDLPGEIVPLAPIPGDVHDTPSDTHPVSEPLAPEPGELRDIL